MKKFETKISRDDVEVKLIVTAIDKEEAAKRIFAITGERATKIKEV